MAISLGQICEIHSQRALRFDFSDFLVGTAEYSQGPTGATVFVFPQGALASVDIRGGAAAVRESSSLAEDNAWGALDAVVLAGGSTYGLDAASGVMKEILKKRGGAVGFADIPAVPAAVIYDFAGRKNNIFPDAALGAQAFTNAQANVVTMGAAGAGVNATVGKYFGRDFAEKGGQGAAFYENKGIKIFVLTVVNAVGNVLNEKGEVIAGSKDPKTGKRVSIPAKLMSSPGALLGEVSNGNTTISIVITNAPLDRGELKRLAAMAHTGMARSIEPFHTASDGDTLFAVSTFNGKEMPKERPSVTQVGTLAASLLQTAVRRAVSSPE